MSAYFLFFKSLTNIFRSVIIKRGWLKNKKGKNKKDKNKKGLFKKFFIRFFYNNVCVWIFTK